MVNTKVVAIGDTQAEFRVTRLVDIHNLIQLFGHCKKITYIVTWTNQYSFAGTNPLESTLVEWLPWRWDAGIGFSRQTCARPQMDSHRGPSDDSWGRGWRRIPRRMQTSLAPVSAEYRPLPKSVRSRRAFSRNLGKDVSCRIQYRWLCGYVGDKLTTQQLDLGVLVSVDRLFPTLQFVLHWENAFDGSPCARNLRHACTVYFDPFQKQKYISSKIQWNDTYLIIQRP